jgi:polyisoprenyl-phosphate glycosyltransferase
MPSAPDNAQSVRCSLTIPVFKNEANIPALLEALDDLAQRIPAELEVVFVVDGSPDRSADVLASALPNARFRSRLVCHARNFGSFSAIRTGLRASTGDHFAVMAADLQEPPELIASFFGALLRGEADVTVGTRTSRADPLLSRCASRLFWYLYKRFVQADMPAGGIDVFGCSRMVRDLLVELPETNTSLVGQLIWLGFRRLSFPYERRARTIGKSAWTLRRKLRYMVDSTFAFTDLPVRLLTLVGVFSMAAATAIGMIVLTARLLAAIPVPGYTPIVLAIVFFAGVNSFGLGVVGSYMFRAFENTKHRPLSVVMSVRDFSARGPQ